MRAQDQLQPTNQRKEKSFFATLIRVQFDWSCQNQVRKRKAINETEIFFI